MLLVIAILFSDVWWSECCPELEVLSVSGVLMLLMILEESVSGVHEGEAD